MAFYIPDKTVFGQPVGPNDHPTTFLNGTDNNAENWIKRLLYFGETKPKPNPPNQTIGWTGFDAYKNIPTDVIETNIVPIFALGPDIASPYLNVWLNPALDGASYWAQNSEPPHYLPEVENIIVAQLYDEATTFQNHSGPLGIVDPSVALSLTYGNINIRNGFEYFRYSFDPVSIIGRPQDFPQTIYDPCNPATIYRHGFNSTQIISDENNNLPSEQGRRPLVSCYPNPIIDKLNILIENLELDNENDLQFKFYDAVGRDITNQFNKANFENYKETTNTVFQVPLYLTNGIYKCAILNEGNIVSSFCFSK